MKKLFFCFLLMASIVSCKKEVVVEPESPTVTSAKSYLINKVSKEEFEQLDWNHVNFFNKNGSLEFINIPLLSSDNKYVYLYMGTGKINGNWVTFERASTNKVNGIKAEAFDRKSAKETLIDENGLLTNIKY